MNRVYNIGCNFLFEYATPSRLYGKIADDYADYAPPSIGDIFLLRFHWETCRLAFRFAVANMERRGDSLCCMLQRSYCSDIRSLHDIHCINCGFVYWEDPAWQELVVWKAKCIWAVLCEDIEPNCGKITGNLAYVCQKTGKLLDQGCDDYKEENHMWRRW